MELVVDTNALFSFFKSDSSTRKIIVGTSLTLYAPQETFTELIKYMDEICDKSDITKKEFNRIRKIMHSLIKTMPQSTFRKEFDDAKSFLSDTSKEDAPFIGLALHLEIPLWSNDKALKRQDKVKVVSTSDLLRIIE
ncbi:MAG: PIN domain-containing protein [Euryarchaeota archaeon]|nr:PIN domain-containing protein [Euryarchaeota archaeon]